MQNQGSRHVLLDWQLQPHSPVSVVGVRLLGLHPWGLLPTACSSEAFLTHGIEGGHGDSKWSAKMKGIFLKSALDWRFLCSRKTTPRCLEKVSSVVVQ